MDGMSDLMHPSMEIFLIQSFGFGNDSLMKIIFLTLSVKSIEFFFDDVRQIRVALLPERLNNLFPPAGGGLIYFEVRLQKLRRDVGLWKSIRLVQFAQRHERQHGRNALSAPPAVELLGSIQIALVAGPNMLKPKLPIRNQA